MGRTGEGSEAHRRSWSIGEARAQFGDLVDRVARDGPQRLTRNGAAVAMLVSLKDWQPHTQGSRFAPSVLRTRPAGLELSDAQIERLFLQAPGEGLPPEGAAS